MNHKFLFKVRLSSLFFLILLIAIADLRAQINPLAAQYYQNPYLSNPSMAGIKQGLYLNLGYRDQWGNMEGAPRNLSATAEYGTERVGIGFNFYKDEAGLISRTKLQGTYAYHLPLNDENQILHLGISFGVQTDLLNYQNIVGSQNDLTAIRFNDQERIWDGDFGLAYSDKHFQIEASVSNMKTQIEINNNISNYGTFMTAASYRISSEDWQLLPKIIYRGVRNYNDILDIGAELRVLSEQLGFMSMYHTNKSMSYGLSYQRQKQWQLLMLYNTPTQLLKSYATGTFEIGLRLKLNTEKK